MNSEELTNKIQCLKSQLRKGIELAESAAINGHIPAMFANSHKAHCEAVLGEIEFHEALSKVSPGYTTARLLSILAKYPNI